MQRLPNQPKMAPVVQTGAITGIAGANYATLVTDFNMPANEPLIQKTSDISEFNTQQPTILGDVFIGTNIYTQSPLGTTTNQPLSNQVTIDYNPITTTRTKDIMFNVPVTLTAYVNAANFKDFVHPQDPAMMHDSVNSAQFWQYLLKESDLQGNFDYTSQTITPNVESGYYNDWCLLDILDGMTINAGSNNQTLGLSYQSTLDGIKTHLSSLHLSPDEQEVAGQLGLPFSHLNYPVMPSVGDKNYQNDGSAMIDGTTAKYNNYAFAAQTFTPQRIPKRMLEGFRNLISATSSAYGSKVTGTTPLFVFTKNVNIPIPAYFLHDFFAKDMIIPVNMPIKFIFKFKQSPVKIWSSIRAPGHDASVAYVTAQLNQSTGAVFDVRYVGHILNAQVANQFNQSIMANPFVYLHNSMTETTFQGSDTLKQYYLTITNAAQRPFRIWLYLIDQIDQEPDTGKIRLQKDALSSLITVDGKTNIYIQELKVVMSGREDMLITEYESENVAKNLQDANDVLLNRYTDLQYTKYDKKNAVPNVNFTLSNARQSTRMGFVLNPGFIAEHGYQPIDPGGSTINLNVKFNAPIGSARVIKVILQYQQQLTYDNNRAIATYSWPAYKTSSGSFATLPSAIN